MNKPGKLCAMIAAVALMACGTEADPDKKSVSSSTYATTVDMLNDINVQLEGMGADFRVGTVRYFTLGAGRPDDRVLQKDHHWVPFDPYRYAQGDDITYTVAPSGTACGLSAAQTEAAIDSAMSTWDGLKALKKVDVVKRPWPGPYDLTIFDYFFGFGGYGYPHYADIVNAGWYPKAFFDAVTGGDGDKVIAFSVSFIWINGNGDPADMNNDGYIDTALNEVYYNDHFGTGRPNNPWAIDEELPAIDVETIALHENGHSLSLGHFGPSPTCVMNPIYGGMKHEPLPADLAGMATVWAGWPNR